MISPTAARTSTVPTTATPAAAAAARRRRCPAAVPAAAAWAATAALAGVATAGTTPPEVTVSTSGSTALKNWFVANTTTFTDVTPGTTVSINGTTYPRPSDDGSTPLAYQLAPSGTSGQPVTSGPVQSALAVRFEYHESGSVEGILELANDQIAPVTFVTQNIDRNPSVGVGNAVWANYNQFGGAVGKPTPTITSSGTTPATLSGYSLGDFYNNNQTFTLNGSAQASFNLSGGNLNGGQNAVQLAVSDAIPVQVFANSTAAADSHAATPWLRTPQDLNYGTGNAALAAAPLGTADLRATYQSTANLNMPATATNPRTGTAFGTGAYNTAGLGNLTSQTVATTATLFVANPGTGLTQVDRTDAQFLETTGRLANGAAFNMTTRDVNSGTRNVSALETGVDPTYAVGVNDDGNGNVTNATLATNQVSIGPGLRFSNKTAGGNQLRPTVQADRFAVGTLSINDATGRTVNSAANPLRALAYSDSTDGSAAYVQANYYTIAGVNPGTLKNDGSSPQYTIFQNEQFVTLQAPDANYGTATPDIQGDDATGDTRALINNTLNSVVAFNGSSPASPAAGLTAQGYIIPKLMGVQKAQNGLNQAGLPSQITANASYQAGSGGSAFTSLVNALNTGDPTTVTTGSGSYYGGSSLSAGGVSGTSGGSGVGYNGAGFNGQIPITNANYLVGNFAQTGVRDYDAAVVQAQRAQAALESSGAGTNVYNTSGGQAVNSTHVTTGLAALDAANSGAGVSKGDLIVLGDLNGDGLFDGRDLYLLATGASLTDSGSRPTEATSGGTTTFTTGHITLATGENFGSAIASSVLNKNTALDYLQSTATAGEKAEARNVIELSYVPAGATLVGTDPQSGLTQSTYDPTGTNAFNKSDVNQDGVVDANDAVLVDKFNGYSYANLGNNITATEQAPVSGTVQPADLVLVSQVDTSTTIGSADLAVMNTALTGTGNTNWYGYNLQKTGPGTIAMARSAGTVTVFGGATLEVSAGTVQVGPAQDPFSDNTANTITSGDHVALVLDNGGKVQFTAGGGTSTVAGLSINTASGSQLDVGKNFLNVQYTMGVSPLATIAAQVASGYANNANNGPGIITSSADAKHTVGYVDTGSIVKVQYALDGDTDLSGRVNITDFTNLKQNFGKTSGAIFAQGDSNHDGKVNITDFTLLKSNFGQTLSTNAVTANAITANAVTADAAAATPSVQLVVNTTTGDGQLVFSNGVLGGYEIDSAHSELTPSTWKTLSSQGYTQFTTLLATTSGLSEAALSGSLTYNGTLDIGNIFNPATTAALRDLDFTYEDDSNPSSLQDIDVPVVYTSTAAPEPTSILLFGIGAVPLIGRRRRRTAAAV